MLDVRGVRRIWDVVWDVGRTGCETYGMSDVRGVRRTGCRTYGV